MLSKTGKSFSILFLCILIAELICSSTDNLFYLHYLTKPAILSVLIIFFLKQRGHLDRFTKKITLLALVFSLLGDILLMFVDTSSNFFIGGLIAFLIAHIMYILVFLKNRNVSKNAILFIIVMLLYGIGLFYVMKDGLGEILIPVVIYMLAILTMLTTAFLRQDSVPKQSFILVFLGAILFMISDSLLALNKFYMPLPFSNISIMFTYAFAQLFIVFGVLKQR